MRRNVSSVSKQFVKKASNLKCVKLSTEEELSKYLEISAYFYNILSQRSSEERTFIKTHLYLSHPLPSPLSVGDSLGFLSDIQMLNSVISSQELNLFLFYSLNFFMHMGILPQWKSMHHMHAVLTEARRGHPIPWNQSYRGF